MNRKYQLFFLLLCPLICYCQLFSNITKKEKAIIEHTSPVLDNITNIKDLRNTIHLYAKNEKLADSSSITVIEDVFEAKLLTNINDTDANKIDALYRKALKSAEILERKDLSTWVAINYAFHLYIVRQYRNTLPYFTMAMKQVESLDADEIIEYADTYTKLGYFISTVREYDRSTYYLSKALAKVDKSTILHSDLLDNIAYNQLKSGKDSEAEKNLSLALQSAKKSNNTIRIAKIFGNKAMLAIKKKDYNSAEKYLLQDYTISDSLHSDQNTIYTTIHLAKIYIETNRNDEAKKFINLGLRIAQNSKYYKSSEYQLIQLSQQIATLEGNREAELTARKKLDDLRIILSQTDGDDALMQMKWATEKDHYIHLIETEKNKINQERILKTLSFFITAALIIVFIIVYKNNKRKHLKEKENFYLKLQELTSLKNSSEEKLGTNKKTLTAYQTYLAEKNNQIEALQAELTTLKNSSGAYSEVQSLELQKLLDSHLMTEENWEKFKAAYKNEYPEYVKLLNEKYPDLTDSNLRIILLTKLEMTNSEIARIIGITIDAVKNQNKD